MADDQDDQQTGDDQSGSQQTADDESQDQGTTDDQSQDQQTSEDQSQDRGTTDDQSQDQQTSEDQSQDQGTTGDQSQDQQTPQDESQDQGTTGDQGQGQQTTDDQGSSQQTIDDQGKAQQAAGEGKSQTAQAAAEGPTKSFVGQNTGATQTQSTGAPDWRGRAKRALTVLQNDSSGEATRTKCMFNHILEESHSDSYISKDFYNVQQTAGGLPANMSMEQFLAAITGHIRAELGSTAFGDSRGGEQSDSDFRTSVLTFDSNIRHHITFLNGVVHQAAPGKVHLALWKLILDARKDPNSIYRCYADYLVDA
jgi:hypothetical protein